MKDTDESSIRNWSDSVPTFSLSRLAGISRFLKNRGWVSSEELPAYYFDIFKYHTQTEQLARESQWKYLRRSSFHSISRGYGITAPVHTPFERPAVVDEIGTLSELQEQVLESLLDYCDREKLPILFTCCPFIIKENDWKVLNAAEALITARGYDFVNFNRYYSEIGLDFDTDFKDVNHVNHLGAEKYTVFLVDYLSAHYDLPDHRGEARYAAWNEDLEAYAEMEQNWRDRTEALVRKHAAARDTGATLPETDVFKTWNSMIQDDSFTVIILQKQSLGNPGKDSSWTAFLGKYGIDPDLPAQMVVQSGRKAISPQEEAAEDGILSFWIGVDSGRGQDLCRLSAERGILTVAGVDYWQDGAAMQVVVYDNNYKTVVDAVMLSLDENGKAVISR